MLHLLPTTASGPNADVNISTNGSDNALLPAKLCIALSGGADSTFLLYMLNLMLENGYDSRIDIAAAIVDHGLRPESSIEAEAVKAYVQDRLSINEDKVVILRWIGDKPKSNIHAIARRARYKLLAEFCRKNEILHLLTGHQQDDQAETVLLRIARGSGIAGLTGIGEVVALNDPAVLNGDAAASMDSFIKHYRPTTTRLIRPLLTFTREEIENTLNSEGIAYVMDPSNSNERFDRVKTRQMLRQWHMIEPQIPARLSLLAKNATRCENFLQKCLQEAENRICQFPPNGTALINMADFLNLHEELALRLLRCVIQRIGSKGNSGMVTTIPRLRSLERLHGIIQKFARRMDDSPPRLCVTLGGCIFSSCKSAYSIVVRREITR